MLSELLSKNGFLAFFSASSTFCDENGLDRPMVAYLPPPKVSSTFVRKGFVVVVVKGLELLEKMVSFSTPWPFVDVEKWVTEMGVETGLSGVGSDLSGVMSRLMSLDSGVASVEGVEGLLLRVPLLLRLLLIPRDKVSLSPPCFKTNETQKSYLEADKTMNTPNKIKLFTPKKAQTSSTRLHTARHKRFTKIKETVKNYST